MSTEFGMRADERKFNGMDWITTNFPSRFHHDAVQALQHSGGGLVIARYTLPPVD